MIDRTSRDRLAETLRQYVSGRISNDTLDDITVDEKDHGAVAVKEAAWHLYDDLYEHKAVGNFYIDKQERKEVARWIVFLQSDEEYIWPKMSVLDTLFTLLTLGLYRKVLQKRWEKIGDLNAWPFANKYELMKASTNPKLLTGKAHNKS